MEEIMEDQPMKNARMADNDRISKLSDDVLHQIMLFLDTRLAVQTSILSKRWKHVWTTLPFLNFNGYNEHYEEELCKFIYSKFINHVFSRRNQESRILSLQLCPSQGLNLRCLKKYVKYAISHDVERLHVKSDRDCSLSTFSSNSVKELNLVMQFHSVNVMESDCWSLPYLTTLRLKCSVGKRVIPESCLICLSALTTLGLENFTLPQIFSLPYLTTLCLKSCYLPQKVWDLPALLTLQLSAMDLFNNVSDYFLALANLRNLDIDLRPMYIGCCVISSSQLANLKISSNFVCASERKIEVMAPKLCNFSSTGFLKIIFQSCDLENVNIKFWDLNKGPSSSMLIEHHKLFENMFSQLGSAKTLTLDSVTLQALSGISNKIVHWRCPFYNLKYLKLPHGCEETSTSSTVRQYLLGGSPSATIVKSLSWENVNPQMATAVSLKTQNEVLEKPFATPTTELFDSRHAQQNASGDGDDVDMSVPKEHVVETSAVDADKDKQIEAPVTRASNDYASPSQNKSYMVLWQGHEVSSEFVGLLDLIMKRYPQTFMGLPKINEKILTVKLNTLCSSINAFTMTSMTDVNTEMLTEYKALFSDLQRWGFDTNWLLTHLSYIKQLHERHAIYSHIDNAKSKLQDMQTLRAGKIADSESFQTTGTSHASTACYIGDGLL